jgi:hypothetical protein
MSPYPSARDYLEQSITARTLGPVSRATGGPLG